MAILKRTLPTAVAIGVGVFVLASVYSAYPLLNVIGTYFIDIAVIIAAFALLLGLFNVLRVHARKIRERQPGRLYSFLLITAMFIVLAVGLPPIPDSPGGRPVFYPVPRPGVLECRAGTGRGRGPRFRRAAFAGRCGGDTSAPWPSSHPRKTAAAPPPSAPSRPSNGCEGEAFPPDRR